MPLRYRGLSPEPFRPLFELGEAQLQARGMRRVIADADWGFPCRVSLGDAAKGETLLLLPYTHQPADTPYRASGPIFVRKCAAKAYDSGALPPVFRRRMLSVRAYDADGMMLAADLALGDDAEALFASLLAWEDAAYLHVHNAKRGCYAARVERG